MSTGMKHRGGASARGAAGLGGDRKLDWQKLHAQTGLNVNDISSMKELAKHQAQKPRVGDISLFGSVVLCFNNMAGPGMLALPVVFQQAGLVPSILVLLLFWLLSSFSATMLCEAMDILNSVRRKYPGVASKYQNVSRFEFSNLVRFYFGNMWYSVSQLCFNISLQSLNIASIIVCAQAVDNLLLFSLGKTHAFQFYPTLGFVVSEVSGEDIFGTGSYVLTLGYVLLLVAFMPLGFLGLSEGMSSQYISFGVTLLMLLEFFMHFCSRPFAMEETAAVGGNATQLLGIMVFSYAFTTLIPSWYNEKKPSVSGNKAVWTATSCMTLVYIVLALFAAWAYPNISSDNVLTSMSAPSTDPLTKLCVVFFCLASIAPGIAVRSIMIRLNLSADSQHVQGSRARMGDICASHCTCQPSWAMFWGVIFPWLVAFVFYEGNSFAHMINWISLTVNGSVCFILPPLLFIKAHIVKDKFLSGRHGRSQGAVRGASAGLSVDGVAGPMMPGAGNNGGYDDEGKLLLGDEAKQQARPSGDLGEGVLPALGGEAIRPAERKGAAKPTASSAPGAVAEWSPSGGVAEVGRPTYTFPFFPKKSSSHTFSAQCMVVLTATLLMVQIGVNLFYIFFVNRMSLFTD